MHDIQPVEANERGDDVHPAFGNITVHRSSVAGGRHGGAVLFDSEIPHQETMTIRVQRATRKRDLNHDWIHGDGKSLLEVEMSMAQWASFVSSINSGSGVPCTIRSTETQWDVPGLEFAPRLALSAAETRSAADRAFAAIKEARDAYEAKKTVGNLRALHFAIENATANVTYATSTLRKHTEDVVQKARADVEAMVVAKAAQLGIDAADVTRLQLEGGPDGR